MAGTFASGDLTVRDFAPGDRNWASSLLASHGGGVPVLARLGELIEPLELEGLVAEREGQPVGLATVHETPERGLEVVSLHADPPGVGAGTALLEVARQVAAASGHSRLWLVTTSDNLPAIRFFLRQGMHVAQLHADAVEADRRLKPQIPLVNPGNGLPIRDLVEFECDPGVAPPTRLSFASVEDLDRLPPEAASRELAPLFEGAPRFLERLVAARPFGSDDGLVTVAVEVARSLPEDEAVQLVDSHPRIGADPASVSELSRAEQGYPGAAEDEQPAADDAWVDEELAGLNEVYEARFGFRYTVFVAGRPRNEIIPLIEAALHNDRAAELRRAVDECIRIAADRLVTLRGGPPPEPEEWA